MTVLYEFEDCCLDLRRGCLRVAGLEVSLRPKSFDLLRYLIENEGRLISKEEIIAAVWKMAAVTDESLARCLSDVRIAIGDRGQKIIKTVPRRGYLFAAAVVRRSADGGAVNASPPETQSHEARPSIAVLALENMSQDPNQDYLSDGISEDIITELSRFRELAVIARNSSFRYKGQAVDVREIGRQLGVRYVLEGSVRRAGDRIRITVQLVEAGTGSHLWAERYDRELTDLLAVQDDVARTVASRLVAHVSTAEAERTLNKPPAAWEAHDYYMRAAHALTSFFSTFRASDFLDARRLAERAISLDPNYARPYCILSGTYLIAWVHPFDAGAFQPATLDRALELARTAVQLDSRLAQARVHLGIALSWNREHDASLVEFANAAALNPNFHDWRFALALLRAGEFESALKVGRSYLQLDPFAPASASAWLGAAHYMLKQYPQARSYLQEAVSRMPNARFVHNWLAATYAQLGDTKLARHEATEALRADPDFTIDGSARTLWGFRSPDDTEHFCDGLRKAGIPQR